MESQPAVCLELKAVLKESVSQILLVNLVSRIERLHFDGILLAEIVRESTHGCQLISVVRIMLEIDVEHIKRLERLFFLSFGFSSLRRGALGNFFLLIHKELVLFIKE